jgi:ATP-dependent DNA helicase RecQ
MKDQVDALTDCGVPAACVNSSLSAEQRRNVAADVRSGRLKLLYLSPERLMTEQTLGFLEQANLSFIAIDEAHCISDWGHDFRPEYRALSVLKETFPGVALHAYTATATDHVRADIARQLHLQDPEILVGSFDRANLVYRAVQRTDRMRQIREVIDRHPDESGIVYCIRRADVEEVCAALNSAGIKSATYHAGMSDEDRHRNQEAFIEDRVQVIVATVAFGMGIDKPDVRFVVHAGAPKSLENYQQESGRAGRDGLEAECCLFYSGVDFQLWRKLQRDLPTEAAEASLVLLAGIERYCGAITCRHRAIVNYFGQDLPADDCGACDLCLGELQFVDDALVTSQKILSCVARLQQSYGANYTALVLAGAREERIRELGHDQLSTYALLKEHHRSDIRGWIEQLVEQRYLEKAGDYDVLQLTDDGRRLLRGDANPRLLRPAKKSKRGKAERTRTKAAADSWEGVDRGLFDALRALRTEKARERSLPPYIIFSDATLRDMARRRPANRQQLLAVHGVGEKKVAEYGEDFLRCINHYGDTIHYIADADAMDE